MNSRTALFFAAFALVALAPVQAFAAPTTLSARYFMATNRSFWRNAMNARHVFPDGFTADLSDLQLRIARLAGLKPVAVKKFYMLAESLPSVSPTPQATPSQRVSWGVQKMLGENSAKDTTEGEGVRIAIIDTGIDRTHADLLRRVDGCFDLTDALKPFSEGSCSDLNGHGTHLAGILVADGGVKGDGMYGFAPKASVSAYRVCIASGSCLSDDIAVAIQHAVDAGVQIIVMGMGGESQSSFIHDAISYAVEHGVMVVAPAGNDGPYDDSLDWPAHESSVVSVGAIDDMDIPAEFSSRGINTTTKPYVPERGDIEFAAPGVNIESTFRDGGYAILSGTSMAVPHIAGLAARMWQFDAKFPAQATRALLHELAKDIARPGDDNATGWGVPMLGQ